MAGQLSLRQRRFLYTRPHPGRPIAYQLYPEVLRNSMVQAPVTITLPIPQNRLSLQVSLRVLEALLLQRC